MTHKKFKELFNCQGLIIGHIMGTPRSKTPINTDDKSRPEAQQAVAPIPPRLLDLAGTASYLSISKWAVRELEAAGILARVRVPKPNQRELRKVLFGREELDHLIEVWKEKRQIP